MTMRCPECGRKVETPDGVGPWKFGDHLNYLKNGPCRGSGGLVGASERDLLPRPSVASIDPLSLALTAAYMGSSQMRRRLR